MSSEVQGHTHSVPLGPVGPVEDGLPTKGKPGRRPKSEVLTALQEAGEELERLDREINLLELSKKEFLEKFTNGSRDLNNKRSTAVVKLRAASDLLTKKKEV